MTDKGPRIKKIPPGDTRERLVCPECDHIEYKNPKIVNIVIPVYKDPQTGEDLFLLVRRNIEPRKGYWTFPGGYMENGETPQEGGQRETKEEAGADVRVGALLVIYQPPGKNEVIMIHRGEMDSSTYKAGIESQEAKLFRKSELPWKQFAFPLVYDGFMAYEEFKGKKDFQPKMIVGRSFLPPTIKIKPPKPPGM